MTSGKNHETATKFWSVPVGICLWFLLGLQSGLIGGLAFLIGGLWLSPDLDTSSKAQKRWGVFKGLWWPYQKLIPHRSIWSHSPFIGTTLRMTYLIALITLVLTLLNTTHLPSPQIAFQELRKLINIYPKQTLAFLIGIEGSVWLHLIQDGDPIPPEIRRWKNR